MKLIRDPEHYFFKHGFSYSHYRGPWLFNMTARLDMFKFGAEWFVHKWKIQELEIHIGFFSFDWTRIM